MHTAPPHSNQISYGSVVTTCGGNGLAVDLWVDWKWIGDLFWGGLGVDWHGLGWIGTAPGRSETYETTSFCPFHPSGPNENRGEQGTHIILERYIHVSRG